MKLLTQKRPYAQLLSRIPRRRGGALSALRAQCNYLGVWPY